MDPYLEASHIWEDVHAKLAGEIQDQLAPKLRPRYYAALTPRVVYDELLIEPQKQTIKPDVGVYRVGEAVAVYETVTPSPEVTPPLVTPVPIEEPVREQRIEIHLTETGELITAIEILSPINKRPGHEAYDAYHRKRRELLRTQVHLLEIDLLRAGKRSAAPPEPLPEAPYFVFLSRANARANLVIWPITLRASLPVVSVPLVEPDPDVPLDLGHALRAIYDRAAYDLRIDYRRPPPKPDFAPDEAAWIEAQLQSIRKGQR
jgi:hypothetical protein